MRSFEGVTGVARAEEGTFRTRPPPGNFGGNLDVCELCAGAKRYLPVYTPGALFSCGDGHAAQDDGEVCINGIEYPLVESTEIVAPDLHGDAWAIVECGEDVVTAARNATSRMVDRLVALKLRLSQVVNQPVYTVSASINKKLLPPRQLFPA